MKSLTSLLIVAMAVLSLGCPARSLFPLFSHGDASSLEGIVGTWSDGKGETFTFQSSRDGGYDVVTRDNDGSSMSYKVWLGKLGKSWFADSYPADKGQDHHYLPSHVISKVVLQGDSLWIFSLESDWLAEMKKSGKLDIGNVERSNDIILTASTEDLQKFVTRFADEARAFPQSPALARQK